MNQGRYSVEFTINIYNTSPQELRSSLTGLGVDLNLEEKKESDEKGEIVRIHIHTDDPYLIFDTCSQFGRLRQVTVEEI